MNRKRGRPAGTYKYLINGLQVPFRIWRKWQTAIRKRDETLKLLQEHFKKELEKNDRV